MIIGIHSIAAFKPHKTGVEKYASRLIENMAMLSEAKEHRFVLYHNNSKLKTQNSKPGMQLPKNFQMKILRAPFLWTQARLAAHFIFKKPNAFFVPAHVLPLIFCPQNSTVMIHDIAYEFFPETYPKFHRNYLRFTTKYALKHAKKIIVPSQNTKDDILRFYKWADERKIFVIYHGANCHSRESGNPDLINTDLDPRLRGDDRRYIGDDKGNDADDNITQIKNNNSNSPYFLYIGRLELKKNILGILRAFDLFKAQHKSPYKLVLVGGLGFGGDKIREAAAKCNFKNDILLTGWVDEEKKNELLAGAAGFIFPSFYEGFGFPILEAQSFDVPVITSCISSMPEIAGEGAILVEPHNIEEIKDAMIRVVSDESLRNNLIAKGRENLKRFSWQSCARQTLDIIVK